MQCASDGGSSSSGGGGNGCRTFTLAESFSDSDLVADASDSITDKAIDIKKAFVYEETVNGNKFNNFVFELGAQTAELTGNYYLFQARIVPADYSGSVFPADDAVGTNYSTIEMQIGTENGEDEDEETALSGALTPLIMGSDVEYSRTTVSEGTTSTLASTRSNLVQVIPTAGSTQFEISIPADQMVGSSNDVAIFPDSFKTCMRAVRFLGPANDDNGREEDIVQ